MKKINLRKLKGKPRYFGGKSDREKQNLQSSQCSKEQGSLKEGLFKLGEGVFSTVVDILLWEIVYLGEAATTFSRDTWTPVDKADRFLEKVNYETIKDAIERGREKGWIKRTHKRRSWPQITEEGMQRLNSIIPIYDKKRVWDKKIYTVIYDVPEKQRRDRRLLREYLKRTGGALIQESVWLTPYNPSDILRDLVKERNLDGMVIVSSIGKDGYVGEEDLKDLVVRIYKLDDINHQYRKFLDKFSDMKASPSYASFSFWSILKKDPQLPFDLLPSYWIGEEAHNLFLKYQSIHHLSIL